MRPALSLPLLLLSLLALSGGCAAHARKGAGLAREQLSLRQVNTGERVDRLRVMERDPKRKDRLRVTRQAHAKLRHFLRDHRTGRSRPVPERLIWNLYLVAQHFDRPLEIVSGYRSKERKSSRHFQGTAVDFRVEGVDNRTVFEYCKRFSKVGLGYYPNSRFVHMDLREKSYFWIDESGPGEAARYVAGVSQKRVKPAKRAQAKRAQGKRAQAKRAKAKRAQAKRAKARPAKRAKARRHERSKPSLDKEKPTSPGPAHATGSPPEPPPQPPPRRP